MTNEPDTQTFLAAYQGARPPAPRWFSEAMAAKGVRKTLTSGGSEIEYYTWGEAGKPGLFFLHGGGAHALWWAHIAPFFADSHRVVAMSMAGMGGSAWRDRYSVEQTAQDMRAVAEEAGLFAAGKPVVAGHSFGGAPTACAAADPDQWVSQAIIIDSPLMMGDLPPKERLKPRPQRFFKRLEDGLARFRFMPPQDCTNHYIADMIARNSLVDLGDKGWSWRFDPNGFANTPRVDSLTMAQAARCKLAIIYGDRSMVAEDGRMDNLAKELSPDTPFVVIPDSAHHIMVDQPLALVAALRALMV
jgi:pimeloyl-ACP methyl ester carboxylesterase